MALYWQQLTLRAPGHGGFEEVTPSGKLSAPFSGAGYRIENRGLIMTVEKFQAVIEKYGLHNKRKFCVQIWQDGKSKVEYSGRDRKLNAADLEKHLAGKEYRTSGRRNSGAIAISLMPGASAPVCLLCIDSDSAKCTAALQALLLPILRKYEIDYVWEFSGNERCHLWIAPFLHFPVAKALVGALFQAAALNTNDYEIFPTKQKNKAVRLPGAFLMNIALGCGSSTVGWRESMLTSTWRHARTLRNGLISVMIAPSKGGLNHRSSFITVK